MAYLTVAEFRTRTVMPGEDVDLLEAACPGFLAANLEDVTSWIDSRLRKRYAVPFAAPVPNIVLRWLTKIVTLEAYKRRGFNGTSEQDREIIADRDKAEAEVKEAADSSEGKFDLPLRQDLQTSSAISQGGPFGYSEAGPYSWMDRQVEEVRRGG
jgi:hypothetical protein